MAAQQLVVLGGTGFVGSHLVPRLAADGHRIVLLSRNREQHRELGVLPTVSVRNADIYDDDVLRRQLAGADAVINLVGILNPHRRHSFQRAHVELARRLIAACHASGVGRLHQMSSLKAGQGLSQYLKTRGEAEALVKASALDWTIYQPSVIFGPGDGLVSRFARLPSIPSAVARRFVASSCTSTVTCFHSSMSIFQPMRREVRRAFWPLRPIAMARSSLATRNRMRRERSSSTISRGTAGLSASMTIFCGSAK